MLLLKMSTILRGNELHFQILIMQYESYSQGQLGFPASVIVKLVNTCMYM